jgi:hypothetical protein
MDQTLAEFLKKDISELRSEIRKDLGDLNSKVDEILKLKWQIIGGSIVFSSFFSLAFSIAIAILTK